MMLNAVSPCQHRELILWSDESPEALGGLNDTISLEGSGDKEWSGRTKSNNSFDRSAS
jgi:hypothetical protein